MVLADGCDSAVFELAPLPIVLADGRTFFTLDLLPIVHADLRASLRSLYIGSSADRARRWTRLYSVYNGSSANCTRRLASLQSERT